MTRISYLLRFVEEDAPFGDVTSEAVIPEGTKARAVIIAKQSGVIAGVGGGQGPLRALRR